MQLITVELHLIHRAAQTSITHTRTRKHPRARAHTDARRQDIRRRERKVNEMFSLGANYTKRNHVIIYICGLLFPELHSAVGSLTVGGLVGASSGGIAV